MWITAHLHTRDKGPLYKKNIWPYNSVISQSESGIPQSRDQLSLNQIHSRIQTSFYTHFPPSHPVRLHQSCSETLNLRHLCKSVVTFSYLVTLLGFVPGYLKIILQEQSTTSLTLAALFLFNTDQIQHLRRPPQEAEIGLRPRFPPFEFLVSRGRSDFSFWMCSLRRALLCGPGSFHMISEPDKWDCIIMLWLLRSSG